MQQPPLQFRNTTILWLGALFGLLPCTSVRAQRPHAAHPSPRPRVFAAIRDHNLPALAAATGGGRAALQARNSAGLTPLECACFRGDIAATELLLKKGARINEVTPAGTALTAALRGGHRTLALMLLKRGAAIGGAGQVTPLMLAAGCNMPGLVGQLANPGTVSAADTNGETALFYAARSGPGCIEALLKMGASVSAPNTEGRISLGEAVAANQLKSVNLLLAAGAKPEQRDKDGKNALHIAAETGASGAIVRAILANKGAIAAVRRDNSGATPLALAIRHGYNETASELRQAPFMPPAASNVGNGADPVKAMSMAAEAVRTGMTKSIAGTDDTCISCHHAGPGLAALAAVGGADTVQSKIKAAAESAIHLDAHALYAGARSANLAELAESADTGDLMPFAGQILFGLSATRAHHTTELSDLVLTAAAFQKADGSWPISGYLSAVPQSQILNTALMVKALAGFASRSPQNRVEERIARSQEWFQSVKSDLCAERAARLLGLKWSGASREDCAVAAHQLLEAQKADGGWPAVAGSNKEGDAFASALALYALAEAGGLRSDDRAIAMAVRYLTSIQLDDGTWYTPAHRLPVCPAVNMGFVHGSAQVSSFNTTCWAILGFVKAGVR